MCIITATAVATALSVSTSIASAIAIAGNVAIGLGAVATVAGTALGAVGSYQQGKAQEAAYNYQAQVAQQNAKIAEQNAGMERQAGLEEARRQRIKTLQAVGTQKVALAANGVDVGYGSSLDLIEDTSMLGELDALMLETEGERKARNYEIQANNYINEANLASYSARNARAASATVTLAGGLKAVGSLASSIGGGIFGATGGFGALGGSIGKAADGSLVGVTNDRFLRASLSSGLA